MKPFFARTRNFAGVPLMAAALLALSASTAAAATADTVPPALRVADEDLVFSARGVGQQHYTCERSAEGFAWRLRGPDALLLGPDGKKSGTHSRGPSWTLLDGSAVTGSVIASVSAAAADAIPWLLLSATSTGKSNRTLSRVAHVQRIDTSGGLPPTDGCDAQHLGAERRVDYRATYNFFAPRLRIGLPVDVSTCDANYALEARSHGGAARSIDEAIQRAGVVCPLR